MLIFHCYVSSPEGIGYDFYIPVHLPSEKINSLTLKITCFLVETHLPTPMTGRVYVNLLEGIVHLPIDHGDFPQLF